MNKIDLGYDDVKKKRIKNGRKKAKAGSATETESEVSSPNSSRKGTLNTDSDRELELSDHPSDFDSEESDLKSDPKLEAARKKRLNEQMKSGVMSLKSTKASRKLRPISDSSVRSIINKKRAE